MSYEVAVNKAWDELAGAKQPLEKFRVKFLGDEYSIDLEVRKVFSLSCNAPAKDFTAILLLHYLARKLHGLPALTGEWLTFRELAEVEGYAAAFRQRAIVPIIRKYGNNPSGILSAVSRLQAQSLPEADAAVRVEAFEGVPALVKLWKADEEFGPDANIYFDRSIKEIFCTEDIIVLAGMIASRL